MTPESYVLSLGGRRCEFIIAQILNKSHISNFRCQPERLLQVRQSIPSSKLFSELAKGSDIFIFAFLNALVTNSRKEIERALAAGQPCFLFYSLPINWTLPNLTSIGNLIVKSGTKNPVTFELGGLDKEQNYQTERIDLEPGHFARASLEYHSLAFVRAHHLPNGRVDVHSSAVHKTSIINPGDWNNLWVYSLEIILAGYQVCSKLWKRAKPMPTPIQSNYFGTPDTRDPRMKYSYIPIHELRPLHTLFDHFES